MTSDRAMVLSNGLRFPDDPNVMTGRLRTLLSRGNYEASEARALKAFVGAGSSVVELGAGIGYISTAAMCHHGAQAVTCIEANPVLCDYIRRVHAANNVSGGRVLNAVALPGPPRPDMPHSLPFHVARPFWSSSMEPPKNLPSEEIEVPTVSLDAVLAEARADALICDIEGGEGTLFEEVDLGPVRFVLVELHTNRIKPEGVVNLFEAMHRHGFFYHQQASGAGVVLFKRFRPARPR
ncbi:FkbM family methyltransferase [Roseovarius salis]|uniref:FkbM family methyltransferase n=1 Tax=Roseovarius salis TaxID=3376063 RepID=UPI0037C7844E